MAGGDGGCDGSCGFVFFFSCIVVVDFFKTKIKLMFNKMKM